MDFPKLKFFFSILNKEHENHCWQVYTYFNMTINKNFNIKCEQKQKVIFNLKGGILKFFIGIHALILKN